MLLSFDGKEHREALSFPASGPPLSLCLSFEGRWGAGRAQREEVPSGQRESLIQADGLQRAFPKALVPGGAQGPSACRKAVAKK